MRKRSVFTAAGLFTLAMLIAAPAPAHDRSNGRLLVDDDKAQCKKAQFTKIQDAVTAAVPGAKIVVCPGTYQEGVTVDKNGLEIRAKNEEEHGGNVVVDANGALAGFLLDNVSGVLIRGFTVMRGHESDIWLRNGAHDNLILHNVTTGPSDHDGIRLDAAHNNRIVGNRSIDNGTSVNGCGIDLLTGSSGNLIRNNVVLLNDRAGIRLLSAGTGNVVTHNRVVRNGRNGILNQSTTGTRIDHNGIRRSTGAEATATTAAELGHGIHLVTSTGVQVLKNSSRANTGDGIRVEADATGNLLEKNHMRRNAEHDCHDNSTGAGTAGTGNTWTKNRGKTSVPAGICRAGEGD